MASDTSLIFNLIAKDKASAVVKSTAKKIGAAAGVAGAAGAAALAGGMVANLEGEAAADKVAASLGLTPAQQKASAEAAGKVFGGAYAGSMGEASAAVGAVVSSIDGMRGASAETLAQMTIDAQNFATAFETDVASAAGAAGVLLKSGLAKDGQEAFDLITIASQKVPVALRQDVLDATNEYSKHFSALGFSGERALGVIVSASGHGAIAMDKAGDALKELTIRGTDMSTASIDAYKALGLNAQDMSNQLLKGGEDAQAAVGLIAGSLLDIEDPAKRANTAIALFGTPLEDMGTDAIPDFLKSLAYSDMALGDVAGSAERMGQTLNDNGQARIDQMRNSLQLWQMDLASSDGALGTATAGISAFGGEALAGGAQFGTLALALRGTAAASMLTGAASGVASAGLRAVGFAVRFAMGPVGIAITVIGLLVAGLIYAYRKSDTFRSIVQGAMRGVSAAFKAVWSAIKAVFGWLRSNWPLVLAILTGPIGLAVYFIRKKWDSIVGLVKGLKSRIGRAASGMWGGITSAFKGAINAIIRGWNSLKFGVPGFKLGPISYGGFSLGVPQIPYLAKGGVATGPTLAMIGEGRGPEAIVPLDRADEFGFGRGAVQLEVLPGAEREFEQFLVRLLRRFVRTRGRGNVQTALGRS